MAVQIGVQAYQPSPRLASAHPYFPPSTIILPPALDPGLQAHSATLTSTVPRSTSSMTTVSVSSSAVPTSTSGAPASGSGQVGGSFDGRRMRSKTAIRRTVDYNSSVVNWIQNRIWLRDERDMRAIQPEAIYNPMMVPPAMLLSNPVNSLATRSVRVAMNKVKCPIFCTCWTPEGRRLVTGASSGEFTLWNGLTFSFETILQAHDTSVRAMIWSHNDTWMLTADHGGYVKYWQSNMNNVKMYQAHKDPIRGLSFCPLDQKFVSCSDDGTVRIWDFLRCHEERILRGHGADVKCVDWHPLKGLVASGSKDTQQPVKLWDPRTGSSLATIHAHKHTVMDLKWNRNGNWLLTASRDHLLKIFDIRNMKEEMQSFRGHKKEATTLAWHPVHECLFASGGSDGAIMFWLVGNEKELGSIDEAHETMVWSMSWHPLGHILVSGSNDHTTKFWTRNRPGDTMKDRYNLNTLPSGISEELEYDFDHMNQPAVPGLGHEFSPDISLKGNQDNSDMVSAPFIPGLDLSPEKAITSDANLAGVLVGDSKFARRRAIYTKPVPKDFERAWTEGQQPTTISGRDNIPDEHHLAESTGPTNADGSRIHSTHPPPFDASRNPYKWHGPIRHAGPEGQLNHDQYNPMLHGPEQMPLPPPQQSYHGPPRQQLPPQGPTMGLGLKGPVMPGPPPQSRPVQHNPTRGMMQPPSGPHNPMMHPMQQQQPGMMPPRPQQPMNQQFRGPMVPPGGPRPLLSLPFQDREMPSGSHPGVGHGSQSHMMPLGSEDDSHHPTLPSIMTNRFGKHADDNTDFFGEGLDRQNNEFHGVNEGPDHGGQFDSHHRDIDYRGNSFDGPTSHMHQEMYPMPGGSEANGRGGWRRPRGGPTLPPPPHPGPDRNQGPNNELFSNRSKPPSLLDMKLGPAPPSSLKRKWESGTEDEPEFNNPANDYDGGQFGTGPEVTLDESESWPEGPRPPIVSRGRGNVFRGGPPGRGIPRGRIIRGGARGR